ncbi:MAG: hypothetical protein H0T15_09615 [Thermoleophilaceae bacterium]|nr:hypothetical protein [Thermoleophilaceae bacterium]
MYHFSRSIYRELADEVIEDPSGRSCANRMRFLSSCESTFERIAADRHYFAKPARSLFNDVRFFFPMSAQMRVLRSIERHVRLAGDYVEQHAAHGVSLDGEPLCCHATTRKGTACQRMPLPRAKYCPSHSHLEEGVAAAA